MTWAWDYIYKSDREWMLRALTAVVLNNYIAKNITI